MKRLILIFGFMGLLINGWSIDPKTQIYEAREYYTKGNFAQAIEQYKSIINAGYVSEELYYNLGNAYFKSHDIKSAILYYEKAKLLDPSDKDVDYNLELARSFTVDKIESMNEVFFVTWLKWFRDQLSATNWAWVSIISLLLTLSSFLLYLLSGRLILRKFGFTIGVFVLFLTIVSFSMGYQLRSIQTANNTAIIFTPTVTVRSTPAESGNNLFVLHEGSKVEILTQMTDLSKIDWCEIRISDGNRGWIKKMDLEMI